MPLASLFGRSQQEKRFFFEKKNKKLLRFRSGADRPACAPKREFLLFFQKEALSLLAVSQLKGRGFRRQSDAAG